MINLIPDHTTIVQWFIFMTAMGVMYFFIFKPLMDLLDRRERGVSDKKKRSAFLNQEAEQLKVMRDELLSSARSSGEKYRQAAELAANEFARGKIDGAHKEAGKFLDKANEESLAEAKRLEQKLLSNLDSISEEVAEKCIDKI